LVPLVLHPGGLGLRIQRTTKAATPWRLLRFYPSEQISPARAKRLPPQEQRMSDDFDVLTGPPTPPQPKRGVQHVHP
jgi:hypothetical protein